MSKLLYLDDSYLKEFEAVVTSVSDGNEIILDQTAFYPESGGQPADHGSLTRLSDSKVFKIENVRKSQQGMVHQASQSGLEEGDRVVGRLDWERRYNFMRAHTAAHILSAVFHQKAGALITGNQIGLEKSRIDFNLENFDREKIKEFFQEANEVVKKNLKVKISYMPREEAEKDPAMFKLAKALPSSIKELRIIEIGDFDRQADGGTHVSRLDEVREIQFLGAENKGKNNRRVYFKLE